ncbi:hypothetical protein K9K85_00580 [Patescibacteria group bacterium]|nr:hypothetical protein [Patescibacteria group bacterium]
MNEVKLKSSSSDSSFSSSQKKKKGFFALVFSILVLVILVVILTIFFLNVGPKTDSSWSAVFLTNGRTYFGQIKGENSDFITLNNVYYLQMQEVPAAAEGEQPQSQLSLMSIEDEMHSPEDYMKINKEHVLFMQGLKSDSSIVTSLEGNN